MPRFYFHSEDGRSFPDQRGTEFESVEAAKVAAVTVLGELLKEDAKQFWETESFRLTVTNENGLTLFILDASAIMPPARPLNQARPEAPPIVQDTQRPRTPEHRTGKRRSLI